MGFTPQGGHGTAAGGQFTPAGGNPARGKTTAGTNAGSFKAYAHGEASVVLSSTAPEPVDPALRRRPRDVPAGGYWAPVERMDDVRPLAAPTAQVPPPGTPFGGNFVPRGMTAEQAYPQAFGSRSRPEEMSDSEIRSVLQGDGNTDTGYSMPPADRALVDDDLAGIMDDPELSDEHKAKFQDMAEQLARFGTVHMALNGPQAIRFGRGSRYGGDKVPYRFASFYSKATADAQAETHRTMDRIWG